jgi:hypothetical protein
MAFNFPSTPIAGDTSVQNGIVYTFDGVVWRGALQTANAHSIVITTLATLNKVTANVVTVAGVNVAPTITSIYGQANTPATGNGNNFGSVTTNTWPATLNTLSEATEVAGWENRHRT